jgi:hypothetical protein
MQERFGESAPLLRLLGVRSQRSELGLRHGRNVGVYRSYIARRLRVGSYCSTPSPPLRLPLYTADAVHEAQVQLLMSQDQHRRELRVVDERHRDQLRRGLEMLHEEYAVQLDT